MREDIANSQYWINENSFCKDTKDGAVSLTNFRCWIEEELTYHDGNKTTTLLKIKGTLNDEEETELHEITIDATELKTLSWVPLKWGTRPIVYPQPGAERDIATIMQMTSKPIRSSIYTHIGWDTIEGKKSYLTTSGAIQGDALKEGVSVQLPAELSKYSLPKPEKNKENAAASLRLVNLGPKGVTWPLLLATYRAAIGKADFAIHLAGRTGTFKSEISSLMQSHFGEKMDARSLPASWNSTANALEALAYKAKDALMVIDDFVPVGTSWQLKQLQSKADQIIRAQGNQAGRTRLTDTSSIQGTMYPRGIILSTGEDVPEGHSVRARMMICELSPGQIDPAKLTVAQRARSSYSAAMADWISWLAKDDIRSRFKEVAATVRDENIGVGHSRTPPIIGELIATSVFMGMWLSDRGYFKADLLQEMMSKAHTAVIEQAKQQSVYLQSSDPVNSFTAIIRQVLATQLAHVKTRNGGVPEAATSYGWTSIKSAGEIETYRANGPQLGWIDQEKDEFLFDPNAMPFIKKHSNGQLAVTPQTFLKRLKDAGMITRTDAARERNTVRMILDGASRNVIVMNLTATMDDQE